MKIIVDKEGRQAILQLLDVLLKTQGLNGLEFANYVLNSIEDYKEQETSEE